MSIGIKYVPHAAVSCLALVLGLLGWNQSQLAGEVALLRQRGPAGVTATLEPEPSAAALEELKNRFERTRIDLSAALHGISQTSTKLDSLQKTVDALSDQMRVMSVVRGTELGATTSPPKEPQSVLLEGPTPSTGLVQDKRKARRNQVRRRWGPEQATGAPDTLDAGDNPSAWAPRSPHSGMQWLQLEYERTVELAEVKVRETFNPGAICRITTIDVNGKEVKIWEGVEPVNQAPVEMSFPAACRTQADIVRIYLDTNRVPGWNEIDAVELVARDGTRQWAIDATASSSYADR
jgi:hypothetical protein